MIQATLLLGTNIGNRVDNLIKASQLVDKKIGKLVQSSAIYQTAAWGVEDQQDFLNQVIIIETELEAKEILENILAAEREMGRERKQKWGPRLIDIDILFLEDKIIDEDGLKVPHPQLQNRRFTLEPLNELMPHFVHPVFNKTINRLLVECTDDLPVELYKNE